MTDSLGCPLLLILMGILCALYIAPSIIILFIRHIPYPTITGSARKNAKKRNRKERTKKRLVGQQKGKLSTPTQAIDARRGKEEQKTEKKRERNRERAPNAGN